MQIARGRLGPLQRNGLRLRDRWSVIDPVLYWMTMFPFRIAALLYWFFNVTVVDAEVADVLSYFGTYFFWTVISFNVLSPGMLVPVIKDVNQHLGSIPISRAAFVGLSKPHGHPFSVTAKGGDRSKVQVQWRLMAPYLVVLALTLIGVSIGIVFDRFAFYDAGDGKSVILFWTLYNILVLALTALARVELPRREEHVADRPEQAIFAAEGDVPRRVWIASLARDTARIRGRSWPGGVRGILRVPGVGDIEATVISDTPDGARLLLTPDEEANDALLRRFYAEGAGLRASVRRSCRGCSWTSRGGLPRRAPGRPSLSFSAAP